MDDKIYLKDLACYKSATACQLKYISKDPFYDLSLIPSSVMKKELADYITHRSTEVGISRMYGDLQQFRKISRFLQIYGKNVKSLRDKSLDVWMKKLKGWMLQEGIPQRQRSPSIWSPDSMTRAREIAYLERVLKFLEGPDDRPEYEKDIWNLENLSIPVRLNPIKNYRVINFTSIQQPQIREELKKGIFFNLQNEAIATVQKEMTAMRRFSTYLSERYPSIKSCSEIDRLLIENYLTYLKTEAIETKHFHADLNRLRAALNSIGKVCSYSNLEALFMTRDIPPTRKTKLKVYSDKELKRLNAVLAEAEEQIARLMIIHQMLGTRISDTLLLETECLYEMNGQMIIRIRQMKANTYDKPVSPELAALIRKAIDYTKERYGSTKYIFVNEKDPEKPMQYAAVQQKVVTMLRKKDVRDDNGEPFGFGTHMYRHTYGMKLTEMHLDDWTIAKLLGHSSVKNVKYYRRMSNQMLAEETRKIRDIQSQIILECLDGWEEEYAKIREDGGTKQGNE